MSDADSSTAPENWDSWKYDQNGLCGSLTGEHEGDRDDSIPLVPVGRGIPSLSNIVRGSRVGKVLGRKLASRV